MEPLRTWLLPAALSLPNAAILALLLLPGGAPHGVLLPAGMAVALVLQLVALGRRRRAPLQALAGTLAGLVIGATAAPEHFGDLCAFAAVYSVAVRRGGRVTVLATAAAVVCGWLPGALRGGSVTALLTDLGVTASLFVACAGLGEARRQWLGGRWAAAGRLARAEEERRQAADTERHRLARELHDVSAHHLTSVVVTVDAARRLGAKRPELVAEALAFAARTGRETLTALHRLATVMRDTRAADPRPVSGRLRELVAAFSRLGRPVDADLPDDLAGPAAEAALAIVREALTNALRHAPGAPVRVRIRRTGDTLALTVDNGPPRAARDRLRATAGLGSGNGVTGMRERAVAVGGDLTAAPVADGGWRVTATLPDSTGPVLPDRPGRWRAPRREQRLTDACLVFTAVVVPLFVLLSAIADGVLPGDPAGMLALAVVLVAHALPLLWRRPAPWAALGGVAATVWLVPAACAVGLVPADWASLLPGAVVAEATAVYAVAAYGRRTVRALGAVLAATVNLVAAMMVTAAADGVLMGSRAEPMVIGWTAFLLLCAAGSLLLTLWGTGLGVRGRRLRMVTRESGALADAVRQTALEAAAERRRIAAELHATVLEHTTRMVARADEGELDGVATETRAALAAMRELLRGLRAGPEGETRHAPQPVAADLVDLCRAWRTAGRKVTQHGLPRAAEGLPVPVSLTVYRVVEAALGAGDRGPARVTLRRRRGQAHLTVTGVPLAAAGPVAERLRVQVEAGEGRMTVDRAGTLRVSLPAGDVPDRAVAQEVASSPYA
ncbi:sensor histidine kinase [Streptomyces sp. enrichment culture]|uniref:sensor histidine kinase n=1 Tax=Streptomyces sp. enrichment culture TaxID=1795815 RepID=UPI003F55AA57